MQSRAVSCNARDAVSTKLHQQGYGWTKPRASCRVRNSARNSPTRAGDVDYIFLLAACKALSPREVKQQLANKAPRKACVRFCGLKDITTGCETNE